MVDLWPETDVIGGVITPLDRDRFPICLVEADIRREKASRLGVPQGGGYWLFGILCRFSGLLLLAFSIAGCGFGPAQAGALGEHDVGVVE